MGDLIPFPQDRVPVTPPTGRPAAVLVLPVVSIERDPAVLARFISPVLPEDWAERILAQPKTLQHLWDDVDGPSPVILKGAELLRDLKAKRLSIVPPAAPGSD